MRLIRWKLAAKLDEVGVFDRRRLKGDRRFPRRDRRRGAVGTQDRRHWIRRYRDTAQYPEGDRT